MDFEGDFNPYAPWCWNMFTNICQQNVPNVVIPSIGAFGEHGFLELSHWDYPLPTWIAAEVSEGGREDQLGGVLAEDESLCIGRFARDLRRRRADLQW